MPDMSNRRLQEYVTTAQAAAIVGMSRVAIWQAIQRGELPGAEQFGGPNGPWMVPRSEAVHLRDHPHDAGKPRGAVNLA